MVRTLRAEAIKRNMSKEFESAYKEAIKEQPKQKADVKTEEPKQITIKKTKPAEKASDKLTAEQTLNNPSQVFPTPAATKEAKAILGDRFDVEYQKFKEQIKDRNIKTEGEKLEMFARRVVTADKLGVKELFGDKFAEAYEKSRKTEAQKIIEAKNERGKLIQEVPQELQKYVKEDTPLEDISILAQYYKNDRAMGIVAPENPTRPYRPGNLLETGEVLWHPKATTHSDIIVRLQNEGKLPENFNFESIRSSGSIAPSGRYYDQGAVGDVNANLVKAQKIAEKKLEKPSGLGTSSQLGMGLDPTQLADVARYGAEIFNKGYKSFSKWAAEMEKVYGNEISPQLIKIWDMSKVAVRETRKEEGAQKPSAPKVDFETEAKQYQKIYDQRHKTSSKTKESLEETGKSASKTLAQTLKPSDTRIKEIDPAIYSAVKLNDHIKEVKLRREEVIASELVKPKGKTLKKQMSSEDASRLDLAFKKENEVEVRKLAAKYGVTEGLNKTIGLLKQVAGELGIEVKDFYFPRMVKNYEKYVESIYKVLNKEPVVKGIIDKVLDERAARKGSKLTIEEQAHIINNTLRGYNPGVRLSKFANEFARTVKEVDATMAQYLHDWDNSLMMYLQEARVKIENRRLLGKSSGDLPEITEKSIGRLIAERKLESSKPLTMQELAELTQILKAGIEPKGVPAWANLAKDVGYTTTLFNFFGSITQAGDIYAPLYRAPLTTLKVGGKMLIGKGSVGLRDVGVDVMQIGREFTNPRQRNSVTRFFAKTSFFRHADMTMKKLAVNTYYERYRKLAQEGKLIEGHPDYARFKLRFGDKANEVIKEFAETPRGELTGRMAFQLWDELDAHQPISRWALPEKYHTSGAMQLGFQMKTFALRRMDYLLNESVRVMKDKNLSKTERVEGVKNFFKLMTVILATEQATGLSKEFLKNLFREGEFNVEKAYQDTFEDWDYQSSLLIDNLMGVVLLSRYDAKTMEQDGVLSALAEKIHPITGAADDFTRDIIGGSFPKYSTKSVPLVGTAIYEWFLKDIRGKGGIDFNFNIPEFPTF